MSTANYGPRCVVIPTFELSSTDARLRSRRWARPGSEEAARYDRRGLLDRALAVDPAGASLDVVANNGLPFGA
jgi:hypothetical protein